MDDGNEATRQRDVAEALIMKLEESIERSLGFVERGENERARAELQASYDAIWAWIGRNGPQRPSPTNEELERLAEEP